MSPQLVAVLAWALTVLALAGCSASFTAVDERSSTAPPSTGTTQTSPSTNFGSARPPRFGPQMP